MTEHADTATLKILVVGGGIGGLAAALGLRQQGHQVIVFERTELSKEFGAAVHLGPNGHFALQKLGIFPEMFGANTMDGLAEYDAQGKLQKETDLRDASKKWHCAWLLCHRVALHESLKQKATSSEGSGIPVVLNANSTVADVDPSAATIILTDGSKYTGDLVLGADGVSSVTRKVVAGPDLRPYGSGKSTFRFMIPRDAIKENPSTAHFVERDGYMVSWFGDDRRLIMYPCKNNTLMNAAGIHPSSMSPAKGQGWDQEASKEALLEMFDAFGPSVKEMLRLVDGSTLKVWTLLDMDRIPRWYTGRLALLGDAAHPFLPYQGQGACMALEDATSLAVLFPKGSTADDIPQRLALYQELRDERAHRVQEATRLSGQDLRLQQEKDYNWVKSIEYNFGWDEWRHSSEALKEKASPTDSTISADIRS